MPVSFNSIPANWRMPLYWVEVDPSMAGYPRSRLTSLIIGTMLPTGTALPDVPIPVPSQADARMLFGYGSMLDAMVESFTKNNFSQELWVVPIAEATAGQAASGVLTVTTSATAAGTLPVYIGGRRVQVSVAAGESVDVTGGKIADAINADPSMPVTAAADIVVANGAAKAPPKGDTPGGAPKAEPVAKPPYTGSAPLNAGATAAPKAATDNAPKAAADGNAPKADDNAPKADDNAPKAANDDTPKAATPYTPKAPPPKGGAPKVPSTGPVVTLTCKWKGVEGNDIDVRLAYGGALAAEQVPVGLAITLPVGNKLTGGSGSPDITTALDHLGDEIYEYVATGFTDSTSLNALEFEYGFSDQGRWGWLRQLYGHVFAAKRGDYATLLAYGPNNNSGVLSVMGVEQNSPTPPWSWAAAYAAKAARALLNDPARPLQTLTLDGCLPPPKHQRFDKSQCNSLSGVGIATQGVNDGGNPMILRESTTYQKNLYGQGDDAYEVVPTLATLAALFRSQRHAITSKFPRHKLADDGTRFGAGQAIVTPKIIKAELIAQYVNDQFLGRVENIKAFKDNLIVERNSLDPNRIDVLYPPDLINQLRIFAVLAQFRLQYDRGIDTTIAA